MSTLKCQREASRARRAGHRGLCALGEGRGRREAVLLQVALGLVSLAGLWCVSPGPLVARCVEQVLVAQGSPLRPSLASSKSPVSMATPALSPRCPLVTAPLCGECPGAQVAPLPPPILGDLKLEQWKAPGEAAVALRVIGGWGGCFHPGWAGGRGHGHGGDGFIISTGPVGTASQFLMSKLFLMNRGVNMCHQRGANPSPREGFQNQGQRHRQPEPLGTEHGHLGL